MKHNASKTRKTWTRILLVAAFAVTLSLTVGRQPFSPAKQAQAKTVTAKEYNQYEHVKVGKTNHIYWGIDVKKVKSSDKSVLTAKVTKKKSSDLNVYGIVVRAKKKGTAKVTVKLSDGSKDIIKYDVGGALTKESKPKFNKKKAQKAFDIQNSYRADRDVDALEWSDELYEFAKYRLETSGYDKHENLRRDTADYFGDFATLYSISFGENLAPDRTTAQDVCKAWKNSSGHYANMIKSSYQCGAIAYDSTHDWWIAVFSSKPASTFVDWQGRLENCATVTVRCLDSTSGEYLTDTSFFYYDTDDITVSGNTTTYSHAKVGKIDATGKLDLALEIGKTYVLHSSRNKTHSKDVTLTVTGDCEVVLTT